jgi:dTDP-4-dehydrorhamnose 3,5-epimerase
MLVQDAYEVTPVQHGDARGVFLEWFRNDQLSAALGYPLPVAQANISVSLGGVLRGLHYADVPPGQAKYVTCVAGAVFDVVVDLRVGSPTFGRWEGVVLDDVDRRAVYVAEGLGHGFCALSPSATMTYFCAQPFDPDHEHGIHPLDADLGIAWPVADPVLSTRDAAAPSLAKARAADALPSYATCQAHRASLRRRAVAGAARSPYAPAASGAGDGCADLAASGR